MNEERNLPRDVTWRTVGPGAHVTASCDQCQQRVVARKRARVTRGPLRGLQGMVCYRCSEAKK